MLVFFTTESTAIIKDSLFATVGNKAVTRSDILEEIKILLILLSVLLLFFIILFLYINYLQYCYHMLL